MNIMHALWRIMNKNRKKSLIIALSVIILLLLGGAGLIFSGVLKPKEQEQPVTPTVEPVVVVDEEKERLKKIWQENKAINEDYIGELFFDSGLINVSFVQAKDVYKPNGELYKFYTQSGALVTNPVGYTGNDVYIWTYWKTGEYDYNDNGGSVFMDYRNDLDDQNIIIYGHHFSVWNDETRLKAFTPLERLLEEKEYADNKFVTLVLENEIRKYELVSVYEFNATQDRFFEDFQYWRTDYSYDDYTGITDTDYYQNYLNAIKSEQLYYTGVDITTDDKTLTLQTCISGHTGELFEILVLKEISVEPLQS